MNMPILTLYPGTPREMMRRVKGPCCKLGRSPANDVQFDQDEVSNNHAMIEWRENHYWICDLNSSNGTYVNGKPVTEAKLASGDVVRLGFSLEFQFSADAGEAVSEGTHPKDKQSAGESGGRPGPKFSDTDSVKTTIISPEIESPSKAMASEKDVTSESVEEGTSRPTTSREPDNAVPPGPSGLMTVNQNMGMTPQGTVCPMCQTMIPFQVNFCPRCGTPVGGRNLPMFPQQMLGGPLGPYVQPQEAPGQGVGILPILAFLCGLSIIGFPFAIILGLVALAQIRKYGGFGSDRTQATWGVVLGCFWALVFAGVVGFYATGEYRKGREQARLEQADRQAKIVAENEELAIDELKGIARAQKLARAIRAKDPSGTGVGQYLGLEELAGLGTSLINKRVFDGAEHGYTFKIRDPSEAGFLAVAEPQRYGETGTRTFAVDASGLVRGLDLKGESFAQASVALPPLAGVKSAYDQMDDTIALEVIAYAKRLASEGQYEKCGELLEGVRANFALTKAAQDLLALKGTVDPFIIEAQADTRYKKAQKAAGEGDMKLAVNFLQEIVANYPSYSKITAVTAEIDKLQMTLAKDLHKQADEAVAAGDLKKAVSLLEEIREGYPKYVAISNVAEKIGEYTASLAQQRDRQARELFARAETLEREGKTDEAMDLYVQIETNFNDTEWARHIASMRPALQKAIREKSAEEFFTQVANMADGGNCRDRLSAVEQLLRNYAQTDFVRKNIGMIEKYHQKVLADNYRMMAEQQMEQGKYLGALVLLDEAVSKNPDMFLPLRDLFTRLYVVVGRKHMADNNVREALLLFRKYLALEPKQKEITPEMISKLSYLVARAEYNQGNYRESMQHLLASQLSHGKDVEYQDLYGMVAFELGNYDEALSFFNAAVKARPTVANYYARRGYVSLVVAMSIEREAYEAMDKFLQQASITPPPAPAPRETPMPPDERDLPVPDDNNSRTGRVSRTRTPPEDPQAVVQPPPVAPPPRTDSSQPKVGFATVIPLPSSGVAYPPQIHYDPLAAQALRNELLDVIDLIRTTSASAASGNDTGKNSNPQQAVDHRMAMLRSGVELGDTVAALNQRILDAVNRKKRTIAAVTRMQQLMASGNRDLAKAIELGADRSQELREILKDTSVHEAKLTVGVPKIVTSLNNEIFVLGRAVESVENLFRSFQAGSINASADPTPMLLANFSKLFDRRGFAEGMQALREAAEIQVPLELYAVRPVAPVQPVRKNGNGSSPAPVAAPVPVPAPTPPPASPPSAPVAGGDPAGSGATEP
jgi:pSer/pThr/pTyr-binding forkhead associated (FHA) protein/tetratricopeptide (TPR) repeat protein